MSRLPDRETWLRRDQRLACNEVLLERPALFSILDGAQPESRAGRFPDSVQRFGPRGLRVDRGRLRARIGQSASGPRQDGLTVNVSIPLDKVQYESRRPDYPTRPGISQNPIGLVDVRYIQLAHDAGELLWSQCYNRGRAAGGTPGVHVVSALLLAMVCRLAEPTHAALLAVFVWAVAHCAYGELEVGASRGAGAGRVLPEARRRLVWHRACAFAIQRAWTLHQRHRQVVEVTDVCDEAFLSILAALPRAFLTHIGVPFHLAAWDESCRVTAGFDQVCFFVAYSCVSSVCVLPWRFGVAPVCCKVGGWLQVAWEDDVCPEVVVVGVVTALEAARIDSAAPAMVLPSFNYSTQTGIQPPSAGSRGSGAGGAPGGGSRPGGSGTRPPLVRLPAWPGGRLSAAPPPRLMGPADVPAPPRGGASAASRGGASAAQRPPVSLQASLAPAGVRPVRSGDPSPVAAPRPGTLEACFAARTAGVPATGVPAAPTVPPAQPVQAEPLGPEPGPPARRRPRRVRDAQWPSVAHRVMPAPRSVQDTRAALAPGCHAGGDISYYVNVARHPHTAHPTREVVAISGQVRWPCAGRLGCVRGMPRLL